MTCKLCSVIEQIGDNAALILDKCLNTLLLGDPNETLSARIARCREQGERWATIVCSVLTFVFNLIPSIKRDHCTWSLEPGSIGAEVWDWSPKVPDPLNDETA